MRVKRSGTVEQDITTAMGRILGRVSISANGSLTDDGLLTGTPGYQVVMISAVGANTMPPTVTFSGNQMTWTFPATSGGQSGVISCVLIYYVS